MKKTIAGNEAGVWARVNPLKGEKMKLENLETDEVRTVEIDMANMNAEVSKELGFPVECLDESRGWFYFWRVGLDSDESDAVALLIK